MASKKLSAGDYIESRCTRCRALTNHTIVAMVEDRVVRVQCNTCSGIHNYKPKAEPKPKASTSRTAANKTSVPRKTRKTAAVADREEWESFRSNLQPERAIAYKMSESYKVKDSLSHSVFGLGLVTRVLGSKKIEVLFEDGRKLLRCQ